MQSTTSSLSPEALLGTAAWHHCCWLLWLEVPGLGELSGSLGRQGADNIRTRGRDGSTPGHGHLSQSQLLGVNNGSLRLQMISRDKATHKSENRKISLGTVLVTKKSGF